MAQHGFSMNGHGGGGINPNDLAMGTSFQSAFQSNFPGHGNPSGSYFSEDELLDGLNSPAEPPQGGIQAHGQDFGMNDMNIAYPQGMYGGSHGLPISHSVNTFPASTSDADAVQSPFGHSFTDYRAIQHPSFGGSLQSPLSYGSPHNHEVNNESGDANFLAANKARARLSQSMQQRKHSATRNTLPPNTMAGIPIGSDTVSASFGAQPIRTTGARHEKTPSGQWMQTPNSISSFSPSGFSSPMQPGMHHNPQISDIIRKGGASMPANLGATQSTVAANSQEAKRKRRRESHNLVERRRRDNINERIQDLSKLVPAHRLEDEKIRKAIQNGTPLSPTLAGISNPSQATSSLAGPGARRAAGSTAGTITTGLPLDEKDKGPNKGDILNGAVSWTRDLMWMLHLKLQQHEELVNALLEAGGRIPFEITDDEQRMQSELIEALARNDEMVGKPKAFSYSRTAGSGLRVPHHTDYKGEPLNGNGHITDHVSISPDGADGVGHDMLDAGEYIDYDDDGSGGLEFKEEDEYGMDLTQ